MHVYHTVSPDEVDAVLHEGLKQNSRGEKGDDKAIIKADQFLDDTCPQTLKDAGIGRSKNVYAYLSEGDVIIDITDGKQIPIPKFVATSDPPVLAVSVDAHKCYVSDLDVYDAVSQAIRDDDQSVLDTLAKSYWSKLTPLDSYTPGAIRRPEIMITYDVAPEHIRRLG